MLLPSPWPAFWFNAGLSVRRAIGGVAYIRCREWPWALAAVEPRPGIRVLDVGSGQNVFPLLLLNQRAMRQSTVVASDINPLLYTLVRFMPRLERRWAGSSRSIQFSLVDATHLDYPDESFDRVTCISAIEHIPDGGDSRAAREIARVLRPGGIAVLTFPAGRAGYDIWHDDDALMRKYGAPRSFWAHVYTRHDVTSRIVEPSGLSIAQMLLVGDTGFHFERWYSRLGKAGVVLRPLLPLMAILFLRPCSWDDIPPDHPNPFTCLLKLHKG